MAIDMKELEKKAQEFKDQNKKILNDNIKDSKIKNRSGVDEFAEDAFGVLGHAMSIPTKAIDIGTTWATETARKPFKAIAEARGINSQTPETDTLSAFKSLSPSDRVGLTNLLTDIVNASGFQASPTVDVDIDGYPFVSSMIEGASNPVNAAAMLIEAGSAPAVAKGIAKGIGKTPILKGPGEYIKDRKGMVKGYVEGVSKDRKKLQDLKDSGQINSMYDMISKDENVGKYIRPLNKEAALDTLAGPVVNSVDDFGVKRYKRDLTQGDIGGYASQQSALINDLPNLGPIDRTQLFDELTMKTKGLDYNQKGIANKIIESTAEPFYGDPALRKKTVDRVDTYKRSRELKKSQDKIYKEILKDQQAEIDALKKIHSEMADEIPNPNAKEKAGMWTDEPFIPNQEKVDLTNQINQMMQDRFDSMSAGSIKDHPRLKKGQADLDAINQKIQEGYNPDISKRNMPEINDMDHYNEFVSDLNKIDNPNDFMNEMRKKGNVYKDDFNPMVNAEDLAARNRAGTIIEEVGDDYLRKNMDAAQERSYSNINNEISTRKNLHDLMVQERSASPSSNIPNAPQGGVVQSVLNSIKSASANTIRPMTQGADRFMRSKGIYTAGQVAAPVLYKIPRDSQKAFEQKDFIQDLMFKEIGPDAAEDFSKISNDPDAIKVWMRNIEAIRPDLFEKDRYGRVDGQIMDPSLKSIALKDLMMNSELSALDRANKLEGLMIEGKFTS